MRRDFLFLSGEFRVTMPLVFSRDFWTHTMSQDKLIKADDNHLRRSKYINEYIKGVIFYADMEDKKLEMENLSFIRDNNFPCWPDPNTLISLIDRHKVLKICCDNGFLNHPIIQSIYTRENLLPFPFVLKTGNEHRGIGKYLINSIEELPFWDGIATMEPFFVGVSVRVLKIGEKYFGIKITNNNSWIKNSPGAEIEMFSPPEIMVEHAKNISQFFNLEISGVDYILEDNGTFHFLEINQFPSLDVSDEVAEYAKIFLSQKMSQIEDLTNEKR